MKDLKEGEHFILVVLCSLILTLMFIKYTGGIQTNKEDIRSIGEKLIDEDDYHN